ncbi:GNAT family N-acetyltransferase [Paracoccus tibetensis]|nr:GNAT family N-acetyltransferase [Paracoccus tibetensis]
MESPQLPLTTCYSVRMTKSAVYSFRKATVADLAPLKAWRTQPHVREWWGEDEADVDVDLGDPRVLRCVVSTGGQPFDFMQDYTVHGWPDHHFADLPEGSQGIDQSIGELEMVGRGHGTAFIRQRVQKLFVDCAPVVATDPHPRNERAIAVYKKLGFALTGSAQETRWGLILPMIAKP